ncbi:MAG: glycine/sarcosine/betaine reductase selenoprotein B family protein [Desulfobacterales bacterium]
MGLRQKKDRALATLYARYPSVFHLWSRRFSSVTHTGSPWSRLGKDISQCRLALITTGGVHLKTQVPFDMNDRAGDPSFREIPAASALSDLTITHNYYDHTDADKDINIVLPIDRVEVLRDKGEIGSVNFRHFSFMGHIKPPHRDMLVQETAPRVAENLIADGVDVAILTPA